MIEERVSRPDAVDIVTLPQVRNHLRMVDDEESDADLTRFLEAAIDRVENITHIAIGEQTWRFYYPCFRSPLKLGRGKCVSVTSIEYVDADGASQSVPLTDVIVSKASDMGGQIRPRISAPWPSTSPEYDEAVTVTAQVGKAPDFDLRQAILFTLAHFYENREEVVIGTIATDVPEAARAICANHEIPLLR